jgi:hypothetical protein
MLNSIKEWLCGFTGDKYVHVMACHLIAFLVAKVAALFVGRYIGAAIGAVVAMGAGIIKEYIVDDFVDMDDIKADLIGSLSGSLLSII